MNIKKRSYGQYSSDNYGAHTLEVQIGELTLWFSYDTVVGFRAPGHLSQVSENCWGPTTGKHLNWLDGGSKQNRLPRAEFEAKLEDVLSAHGLTVGCTG
jgi:hypothetical protein